MKLVDRKHVAWTTKRRVLSQARSRIRISIFGYCTLHDHMPKLVPLGKYVIFASAALLICLTTYIHAPLSSFEAQLRISIFKTSCKTISLGCSAPDMSGFKSVVYYVNWHALSISVYYFSSNSNLVTGPYMGGTTNPKTFRMTS